MNDINMRPDQVDLNLRLGAGRGSGEITGRSGLEDPGGLHWRRDTAGG